MNKRLIILIIIIIFILLLILTFLLIYPIINIPFINNFTKKNNNYVLNNKDKINEKSDNKNENKLKNEDNSTDKEKITYDQSNDNLINNKILQKNYLLENKDLSDNKIKDIYDFNEIDLSKINFNALGNYVSEEEKQYRLKVIKNLRIKTIVINNVTKGNGISQEFYKVVYLEKMIPAKILDEIVESKEFRNLIPKKYLTKEEFITSKNKNVYVKFLNNDIKKLLILWCFGKLTPIQKAWETKAVK